jgi:hypothetical protein
LSLRAVLAAGTQRLRRIRAGARGGLSVLLACNLLQLLDDLLMVLNHLLSELLNIGVLCLLLGELGEFDLCLILG